jgi:hypothetical protein
MHAVMSTATVPSTTRFILIIATLPLVSLAKLLMPRLQPINTKPCPHLVTIALLCDLRVLCGEQHSLAALYKLCSEESPAGEEEFYRKALPRSRFFFIAKGVTAQSRLK